MSYKRCRNFNRGLTNSRSSSYFLDGINPAEADATFWSMTARELAELDPQQRLALEVAYEALQSSGTTKWQGTAIGCYVGIFGEVRDADFHTILLRCVHYLFLYLLR